MAAAKKSPLENTNEVSTEPLTTSDPAPVQAQPNLLTQLKNEISTATEDEKEAITKALGLGKAIGKPKRRPTQRQTNESAAELARMTGGASHGPDFLPAPPDWVVEHGGGMEMEEVEISDKDGKLFKEMSPIPGAASYQDNWTVQIYWDRWMNNKPPLPSVEAYNAEREEYGSVPDAPDAEMAAAGAVM